MCFLQSIFLVLIFIATYDAFHLENNTYLNVYDLNDHHERESELIGGGEKVNIKMFPWQVAIFFTKFIVRGTCGGFLVAPQYVMTAAHCCSYFSNNIRVELGVSNMRSTNVGRRSERQFIYPFYLPFIARNDIALIRLNEPVTYNSKIKAIKLPYKRINNFRDYPAMVSGYGKDSSKFNKQNKVKTV